jgi:putative salt-induced outer membrane protein
MLNRLRALLTGVVLLFPICVIAQQADGEQEEPDRWSGDGEVGFVKTTGNTESDALNLKLNFTLTTNRWRYQFRGTALVTSEDDIRDNERYTAALQGDRKLDERNYLFSAYRFDADKFGAYDPQQALSAGVGRKLMVSETHTLKAEIGLGYRKLKETESGEKSDEAIVRFLADDSWQITETTQWTNRLLTESGSDNVFAQFNTGLAVSIGKGFALKVGFEYRHNTKIPPGDTEKTDTTTTVNLLYSF